MVKNKQLLKTFGESFMVIGEKKYLDAFFEAQMDTLLEYGDEAVDVFENEFDQEGVVRSFSRQGVTVHLVCVEDIINVNFEVR